MYRADSTKCCQRPTDKCIPDSEKNNNAWVLHESQHGNWRKIFSSKGNAGTDKFLMASFYMTNAVRGD